MKRFSLLAIVALLLVSLVTFATPVSAVCPPNSNTATGVGLTVQILDTSDNPIGQVHVGQVIKFKIYLNLALPLNADFQGGTLALRVANHSYQHVAGYMDVPATAIPHICFAEPFSVITPFTYTVSVADIGIGGAAGYIHAFADYGATGVGGPPDGVNGTFLTNPVQPTASATASGQVLVLAPSILITKSASPDVTKAGHDVAYTFNITNNGNVSLNKVSVTDTLLGDISASFPATLAVSASSGPIVINRTVLPGDPDPLPNTVEAIYSDTDLVQASASAADSVDLIHPAISVTKTVDDTSACIGQTINYNVTVENTGDVDLNLVSFTDTFNGATTDISTNFQPVLLAQTSQSYNYGYTIQDSDPTPLMNSTEAHYAVTGFNNDITDIGEAPAVVLTPPSIEVTKTANIISACPGDEVRYTVSVRSESCVDLNKISFVDSVVGDVSALFPAVLPPGVTQTANYTYTIPDGAPNPLVNTVTAVYQVPGTATNVTDSADATVTCPPPVVGGFVTFDNGLLILLLAMAFIIIGGGMFFGLRRRQAG